MSTTRVNIGDPTRASDVNHIIPVNITKSTSYTITDTGGKQFYVCSPSTGSTITITLPTLSANKNRELIFIHGTTAAGYVKIEGEGAENISGSTAITLRGKGDVLYIEGSTSEWKNIGGNYFKSIKAQTSTGLNIRSTGGAAITGSVSVTGKGAFSLGVAPAAVFYYSAARNSNQMFDDMDPYVPVVGDKRATPGGGGISGAVHIFSYIERTASTKIVLATYNTAAALSKTTFINGSTAAKLITGSWAVI